jgi:hypothetical protein
MAPSPSSSLDTVEIPVQDRLSASPRERKDATDEGKLLRRRPDGLAPSPDVGTARAVLGCRSRRRVDVALLVGCTGQQQGHRVREVEDRGEVGELPVGPFSRKFPRIKARRPDRHRRGGPRSAPLACFRCGQSSAICDTRLELRAHVLGAARPSFVVVFRALVVHARLAQRPVCRRCRAPRRRCRACGKGGIHRARARGDLPVIAPRSEWRRRRVDACLLWANGELPVGPFSRKFSKKQKRRPDRHRRGGLRSAPSVFIHRGG